ncbi:MAG: AMP-binding protein, partial [Anaerolineae bacterium]|nr:AMP-binding protein [Anaerolineae bacterium]
MTTYADKPWLKSYDPGVPHSLKPYPEYPVHATLENSVQKHPTRTALVASAHLPVLGRVANEISYQSLNDNADAMAAALVALGLQKGDRVVIIMPNCVQFAIAFFAILKAGGVVAATNPTYPPDKMKQQINDSSAKIAITLSLFYNMIVDLQPDTPIQQVIVTNIKEYLPGTAKFLFTLAKEKKDGHRIEKRPQDHWMQDLLTQYQGKKANVQVTGNDLALFQYTGGTTGISKAAMATHTALVANAMMISAWLFGNGNPTEESYLGAIPMFHVFGLVAVLISAVNMGSKIIIVPNAREIDDVLDNIHTFRPSIFPGVPALYNAINNNEGARTGKYNLSSIRACISGSAPLPPATKEEFE